MKGSHPTFVYLNILFSICRERIADFSRARYPDGNARYLDRSTSPGHNRVPPTQIHLLSDAPPNLITTSSWPEPTDQHGLPSRVLHFDLENLQVTAKAAAACRAVCTFHVKTGSGPDDNSTGGHLYLSQLPYDRATRG
jgi:hypothetical protein